MIIICILHTKTNLLFLFYPSKLPKLLCAYTHGECNVCWVLFVKVNYQTCRSFFLCFILMTDSDYSQEVNKMNEHDVSTDHSFTFISGYLWF